MCTKFESFGDRELYTPYYAVRLCVMILHMTYLLRRTKLPGGPVHHSRYTLLRTRAQNRGVVKTINTNT